MKKICLSLLFVCTIIFKVEAFNVQHDFIVFVGPFNASETYFEYALTPFEYSVKSGVKTFGTFKTLYPFEASYATTGKIKDQELETMSYKSKSKSRFTRRHKELVYDNQGQPIYRISSKNDKKKRVEIRQDVKNKDTTDLQTVFAELARQYNKVKFCDARMEVFDGKKRFDVIFKDEGQDNLSVNKESPFSGVATKCSMYIDNLGAKGDDLLWDITSDKPIYFWIQEDAQYKIPFIARVDIENTDLGRVQVLTKNITIKE